MHVLYIVALVVAIVTSEKPYETESPPDHCPFTDWEEWGPCTAPCGGGVQSRHRFLKMSGNIAEGAADCSAADSGHQECNTDVCSNDCMLSTWSVFGHCDCKAKKHTRSRMVLQWPSNGGEECGALKEEEECSCDRDCVVGEWGLWSSCSATCGFSASTRSRPLTTKPMGDGSPCSSTSESRACVIYECPMNETLCEGVDGVFANPAAACSSRYITCDESHLVWNECPSDLVFDPHRRRCATPHRVPECAALLSSSSIEAYVPVRSATLVASFAILLIVLAVLVRTLAWHIPNTATTSDEGRVGGGWRRRK